MLLINIVLILYVIAGYPIISQRSPSISYITQNQYCEIGGSVKLDCVVNFADDYNVQWIKVREDVTFLAIGASIIIDDSRFAIDFEEQNSMYILKINDLQEIDSGIYKCRVVLSSTEYIEAQTEIYLLRSPIILDNSTQSLIATEGDAVEMVCSATGYPPPTILWRNSMSTVLPTGSAVHHGNVLKFPSVRKEHRGTYYCIADNAVGRSDKRNINLEVEFAPTIKVERPNVGQAIFYPADLLCHIEAFPAPAIWWEKEDEPGIIVTNRFYIVSQFISDDEVTDITLRVIKTEKRQFGVYYCKAGNRYGITEARVNFYETVIPVCPPACG